MARRVGTVCSVQIKGGSSNPREILALWCGVRTITAMTVDSSPNQLLLYVKNVLIVVFVKVNRLSETGEIPTRHLFT